MNRLVDQVEGVQGDALTDTLWSGEGGERGRGETRSKRQLLSRLRDDTSSTNSPWNGGLRLRTRGDGRVRGVRRAHAGRRTLGAAASRRTPGTRRGGVCMAWAVVKSLDLDQVLVKVLARHPRRRASRPPPTPGPALAPSRPTPRTNMSHTWTRRPQVLRRRRHEIARPASTTSRTRPRPRAGTPPPPRPRRAYPQARSRRPARRGVRTPRVAARAPPVERIPRIP